MQLNWSPLRGFISLFLCIANTPQSRISAPRNFSLATIPGSPNALSVSWMEPDSANRSISGYTISCQAPLVLFSYCSSLRAATLENLLPFTNYTCAISASTDAGSGEYSDSQTARTDEDGKQKVYYFSLI